jgi:hypothetical protein
MSTRLWVTSALRDALTTGCTRDAACVQPTADELGDKLTFLEHNAQRPRTLVVELGGFRAWWLGDRPAELRPPPG